MTMLRRTKGGKKKPQFCNEVSKSSKENPTFPNHVQNHVIIQLGAYSATSWQGKAVHTHLGERFTPTWQWTNTLASASRAALMNAKQLSASPPGALQRHSAHPSPLKMDLQRSTEKFRCGPGRRAPTDPGNHCEPNRPGNSSGGGVEDGAKGWQLPTPVKGATHEHSSRGLKTRGLWRLVPGLMVPPKRGGRSS